MSHIVFMSVRCNGSSCSGTFTPLCQQHLFTVKHSLSASLLTTSDWICLPILAYYIYKCIWHACLFLLYQACSVLPSEGKRKWCHATTTALRGTTGDPGSGETYDLLAYTTEEPIIAVPLPSSMATTVRGSFPSQSSPPSCPPQLQLPWQHRAAT